MGILTDRFGGRAIFTILMAAVAFPVWIVPQQATYSGLLTVGFLLGGAGSSFAIGVGHVSRWTPPDRQGRALGVYGLGNIGQPAAVFLGPVLAAQVGMPAVDRGVAVLLVVWAAAFALLARDAPAPAGAAPRKGIGDMLEVLTREKLSWLLAAFYFLTFGGFVAFSIDLPTLLRDQFHLPPTDAGFRTAGFVVLATLLRPLGGWLSDRIGGSRVLSAVFLGVAPFAMLLAWPSMIPFTVGALAVARHQHRADELILLDQGIDVLLGAGREVLRMQESGSGRRCDEETNHPHGSQEYHRGRARARGSQGTKGEKENSPQRRGGAEKASDRFPAQRRDSASFT